MAEDLKARSASSDPHADTNAIVGELAEIYLLVGPLYRRALRRVERAEPENQLSVAARAVLDQLVRHGPMTVPQIGRSQSLSRQFVQRTVDVAVADGLVEVVDNPVHRRSHLVRPTATGRRRMEIVVEQERAELRRLALDVDAGDVASTRRVLRLMVDALDDVD